VQAAFRLSAAEAASPICVAFRAADTLGQVSEGSLEVWFEPQQGNTFRGCTLGPGTTPHLPLAVALACMLGLGRQLLRRRRS
jgi:hypothetical protein